MPANPQNLIPTTQRSKEEVRKNSRKGGIKSGQVRREKKLLSQMYAEQLSKILGEDGKEIVELYQICKEKNPSAAVSLLKEMREATEGSKTILAGDKDNQPVIQVEFVENTDSKDI